MSPIGRAAKFALSGPLFAEFLNSRSEYRSDGYPVRRRRYVNGRPVLVNDARVTRRWRAGAAVTRVAAERVLAQYGLTWADVTAWAQAANQTIVIRGEL